MTDIDFPPPHPDEHSLSIKYPSVYDLQDHAEASLLKRGIARYLIPRNYEKSIKRHQALGSPVVRKLVMNTVGRLSRTGQGFNYRLDYRKSRIEASMNFALKGSVFNEVVHTVGAIPSALVLGDTLLAGSRGVAAPAIALAGIATNLSLVALQRYNRARMIKTVDAELQNGYIFRDDYRNYLGIDARAVDGYIVDLITQKNNTLPETVFEHPTTESNDLT